MNATIASKIAGMALGALLLAGTAQATIVNIAASTPTGVAPQPVTVAFGPGTYTSQVIGTSQGGTYNAWSVATPAPGNWDERYNIGYGGTTTQVNPYSDQRFASAADALSAFANQAYSFTLDKLTDVTFSIPDYLWSDNTGGVSLSVSSTDVPEPGTMALFAAAVAGVVMLRRRKAKTFA